MKTKCEICGEMVPQQDMSKSYKHRCKKCVAQLARIDRKAAKQRAENIRQQLEGTVYSGLPRRKAPGAYSDRHGRYAGDDYG